MIVLTSSWPNTMPMHLCAPPPNGVNAYRCLLCSLRGSVNRAGSNFSGSVQISGSRWFIPG